MSNPHCLPEGERTYAVNAPSGAAAGFPFQSQQLTVPFERNPHPMGLLAESDVKTPLGDGSNVWSFVDQQVTAPVLRRPQAKLEATFEAKASAR